MVAGRREFLYLEVDQLIATTIWQAQSKVAVLSSGTPDEELAILCLPITPRFYYGQSISNKTLLQDIKTPQPPA